MHHYTTLAGAFTVLLAAVPTAQAMYSKSSPVLQLNTRNFDSLVTKSNHTSIVEFYAPWCGHCQNLKPAYEKAAKNLEGLAKVAAVNCDDDSNKSLCGAHGVQGFPTLKIFRPGKKQGSKPIVEDYKGPRTASGITDEVVKNINNHVSRITDKEIDSFIGKEGPKALLFTDKGTTSALLRSVAIDYLGVMHVGQIRNKEKGAVKQFGIEKFPTLVLIPEGAIVEPIVYDGELRKKDVMAFLSRAVEPNPDPAPAKGKVKKGASADEKAKAAKLDADANTSPTTSTAGAEATTVAINSISSAEKLQEKCLQVSSNTCVLAIVPAKSSDKGDQVVQSLSKLNAKYIHGKRHLFPFFSLSTEVAFEASLRSALKLADDVDLVAINARRGWWRQYKGDFSLESVESWIDAIRMGEGDKNSLPNGILIGKKEEVKPSGETQEAEPVAGSEASKQDEVVHEEL
ncbi:protein disulfide-isomerase A6 [Geosmithia morbida]|uniref:protein disulfide-isomerase n=1 Tax=Geosmithia morbida TaxID=1094350 RepID=A0A9P5D2B1_9HYPO|nr:protein disulfide-isomerase A6 [Geosmithia morbida]KAF4124848.1 protein disulfide-isomerase A6 [Geosmithia morbida]